MRRDVRAPVAHCPGEPLGRFDLGPCQLGYARVGVDDVPSPSSSSIALSDATDTCRRDPDGSAG
jgi:hypothetical protein